MKEYETKTTGEKTEFANGFVRDKDESKPNFGLMILAGVPYREQPITQHAELLTRGARHYGDRNWEKSFNEGDVPEESPELEHAKSSLLRHAIQLACGEDDEDHASAVKFNADFIKMLRRREAAPQEISRGEVPNEPSPPTCGGFDRATDKRCSLPHWHDGFCNSQVDDPEPTAQKCGAVARDSDGRPGIDEDGVAYPRSVDAPCTRRGGHEGSHRDAFGATWEDRGWCPARMESPTEAGNLVCLLRADHIEASPDHVWDWDRPVAPVDRDPREACGERHPRPGGGHAGCVRRDGHLGEHDHRPGWAAR